MALDLAEPMTTSLRERAARFAQLLGHAVRPALYTSYMQFLDTNSWVQANLRLPLGGGPFVCCGINDDFIATNNGFGDLRLSVGKRRYLNEVDVRAVLGHKTTSPPAGTWYPDWPSPIVMQPGEVVSVEFKPDPEAEASDGALTFFGFHVDPAVGRLFAMRQLWAHTLRLSVPVGESAEADFVAQAPLELAELVTASTSGVHEQSYALALDTLSIELGPHVLTPQPLTHSSLSAGTEGGVASLEGLRLAAGETIRIRGTVDGGSPGFATRPVQQKLTVLGRQGFPT